MIGLTDMDDTDFSGIGPDTRKKEYSTGTGIRYLITNIV